LFICALFAYVLFVFPFVVFCDFFALSFNVIYASFALCIVFSVLFVLYVLYVLFVLFVLCSFRAFCFVVQCSLWSFGFVFCGSLRFVPILVAHCPIRFSCIVLWALVFGLWSLCFVQSPLCAFDVPKVEVC
jgi:hypothetical protein